jgi:hypothetical protein
MRHMGAIACRAIGIGNDCPPHPRPLSYPGVVALELQERMNLCSPLCREERRVACRLGGLCGLWGIGLIRHMGPTACRAIGIGNDCPPHPRPLSYPGVMALELQEHMNLCSPLCREARRVACRLGGLCDFAPEKILRLKQESGPDAFSLHRGRSCFMVGPIA